MPKQQSSLQSTRHGALAVVIASLIMQTAQAAEVLVNDPLEGSTTGTILLGEKRTEPGLVWADDGGVRSLGDCIVWDAGRHISRGYFEFKFGAWDQDNPSANIEPWYVWEKEQKSLGNWLRWGKSKELGWNSAFHVGGNHWSAVPEVHVGHSGKRDGYGLGKALKGADYDAIYPGWITYRLKWDKGLVWMETNGKFDSPKKFDCLKHFGDRSFKIRYVGIGVFSKGGPMDKMPVVKDIKVVDLDGEENTRQTKSEE